MSAGFLLALVLIFFAWKTFGISITGLFSPEYAGQPEWTGGKIWDLAKHIWVPILIAGIGGTAGLFRVMRGNLLNSRSLCHHGQSQRRAADQAAGEIPGTRGAQSGDLDHRTHLPRAGLRQPSSPSCSACRPSVL